MEFNIGVMTKIAEIMAEEVRQKLGPGAEVAEIKQSLRKLAKEACGIRLQKAIEAREENIRVGGCVPVGRKLSRGGPGKRWCGVCLAK